MINLALLRLLLYPEYATTVLLLPFLETLGQRCSWTLRFRVHSMTDAVASHLVRTTLRWHFCLRGLRRLVFPPLCWHLLQPAPQLYTLGFLPFDFGRKAAEILSDQASAKCKSGQPNLKKWSAGFFFVAKIAKRSICYTDTQAYYSPSLWKFFHSVPERQN